MKTLPREDSGIKADRSEIEPTTGQPIEEAEKNLSRHATRNSSPPVDEQWRTSVKAGGAGQTQDEQGTDQNRAENNDDKG